MQLFANVSSPWVSGFVQLVLSSSFLVLSLLSLFQNTFHTVIHSQRAQRDPKTCTRLIYIYICLPYTYRVFCSQQVCSWLRPRLKSSSFLFPALLCSSRSISTTMTFRSLGHLTSTKETTASHRDNTSTSKSNENTSFSTKTKTPDSISRTTPRGNTNTPHRQCSARINLFTQCSLVQCRTRPWHEHLPGVTFRKTTFTTSTNSSRISGTGTSN